MDAEGANMFKWIHHLLNPHCEHCIEEEREKRICNTCEILKEEVTRLRFENERLIDKLTARPEEPQPIKTEDLVALPASRFTSWNVRRQMLEEESRKTAKLKQDLEVNAAQGPKTITELEQKMGVEDAS